MFCPNSILPFLLKQPATDIFFGTTSHPKLLYGTTPRLSVNPVLKIHPKISTPDASNF
jgi:hypothetical protein